MKRRPLTPSLNPSGSRALKLHVINLKYQQIPISFIMPPDEFPSAQRLQSGSGWADPRGRDPFLPLKWQSAHLVLIFCVYSIPSGLLLLRIFSAMDKKASASKSSLSPQERIELLRTELESIKATTAKNKWEMLAIEMQDIKDDLSDELQAGLKDAANLLGDLGKRLVALERQVEGLTSALGKISDATAEVSSKKDR
jgi:hypothetical protein